ncbi:MAG: glycoside hydrolase family 3 N-terminal domain-containing protein [Candidatus Saccharimonadaceae bacterium]|nr:glycoside hydrolase family 3 N-terminal domain-containing protein [Candidatus Saccharimonadaceae bacterium]
MISLGIFTLIALSVFFSFYMTSESHKEKEPETIVVKKPEPSFAETKLASMTLRQKVASLLILHASGSDVATLGKFLIDYQPSGLIFMPDNIGSMTSAELGVVTTQLQIDPELPYLFAIDEEGGTVQRLIEDSFPSALDLKTQPADATETAFSDRSAMLKQAGMNLNFGIIADITDNPSSFIYPRVLGIDPTNSSDRVAAAVRGEKGNVISTLKHYPGHGETTGDSHYSIPVTDISYQQWQDRDEKPFVSGIKAGAQFVMFGHLTYSAVDSLPASLSIKWHDIIRQRDNFKGIIITDDMLMLQQSGLSEYSDPIKNAVNAINAGNTVLLYVLGSDSIAPNDLIDGIVSAVDDGTISQDIININVKQVLELRHGLVK